MIDALVDASALDTSSTRRRCMIASKLTFATRLTGLQLAIPSIFANLVGPRTLKVHDLDVLLTHCDETRVDDKA